MSESIVRLLKYIKGNTDPCTSRVSYFVWFWLLVVELWRKCCKSQKWFYSWNNVCLLWNGTMKLNDDFVQKFPNSVSPSIHAIYNLIYKIETNIRWFTVLEMTILDELKKWMQLQWMLQNVPPHHHDDWWGRQDFHIHPHTIHFVP